MCCLDYIVSLWWWDLFKQQQILWRGIGVSNISGGSAVVDSLFFCGVSLCLVLVLIIFSFCKHLAEEERITVDSFTFISFPVSCLLVFCGSSSQCRGLVKSVLLWIFLVILIKILKWKCVKYCTLLMPHNAAFSSGSTLFAQTETIFREENTILFGNYNLWPLDIYNGPSQVYYIKLGGIFH